MPRERKSLGEVDVFLCYDRDRVGDHRQKRLARYAFVFKGSFERAAGLAFGS